ncbi:hypothetical protein [Pseudonocardia sp.]|uniref:hypothetical protein n=1 Tax=Pseudonocardia sp. TaxID=60912 RepID=UPI0026344D9E|nr:hypothetical protein [Pseudonocardia sp.]
MTADPERRLSEALRAQARGGGRSAAPMRDGPARSSATSVRTALVIALLGGAVLGTALALLSLLTPGLLPTLG